MSGQMSFPLPRRNRQGRSDFFVGEGTTQALAMIGNDEGWPDGKLALVGEGGSGKSHLVAIWGDETGAHILSTGDVADALPRLIEETGARVAVEDIDQIASDDEEPLFHLHNHLRASGGKLLITGRSPPNRWRIALPDLASRLSAATVVEIATPDEATMTAVLAKQFDDRQIVPPGDLVAYLARHLPRSYAAARSVVEELDRLALDSARPLTRNLALSIIDAYVQEDG